MEIDKIIFSGKQKLYNNRLRVDTDRLDPQVGSGSPVTGHIRSGVFESGHFLPEISSQERNSSWPQ